MAALEAQRQPTSDTPMEAAAPPEMPWWMQPVRAEAARRVRLEDDEERAEIKRGPRSRGEAFIRTPRGRRRTNRRGRRAAPDPRRGALRRLSVHDHVPKREHRPVRGLIGKPACHRHDRYGGARSKRRDAWLREQAQNATRFFMSGRGPRTGTVAGRALRQATFDEAEVLCAGVAGANLQSSKRG